MADPIIESDQGVTLVGCGGLGEADLALALTRAPVLVAADGGARAALSAGHLPAAVIGDFDSLSPEDQARIPAERCFVIAEQETTDFDKALARIAAPLVLAVGFLGGRMDHQLAALNTLVRHAHRRCVLIGGAEVIFHVPPRLDLALQPDDVVSLFPLAPVRGRSTGLHWPIDGLDLAPDGRVGTSNRAAGRVGLQVDGPGLLMMAPRRALDAVLIALQSG